MAICLFFFFFFFLSQPLQPICGRQRSWSIPFYNFFLSPGAILLACLEEV